MSLCTWNPADKDTNILLSNANQNASSNTISDSAVRAKRSRASGKWYFEVTFSGAPATDAFCIGLANSTLTLANQLNSANGWGVRYNGSVYSGATLIGTLTATITSGDIVGVAVDFATGRLWYYINNVLQNGTAPPDGTNFVLNTLTGTLFPAVSISAYGTLIGAFHATEQTYAAPAGFLDWDNGAVLPETCTSNADVTATLGFANSLYHTTLTSNIVATATHTGIRVMSFVESANAAATLTFTRAAILVSDAIATAIVAHKLTSAMILTSEANAIETAQWRRTVTMMESANAAATLTGVRTLTINEAAVASAIGIFTARMVGIFTSDASAAETLDGRRGVSLQADAVAAATADYLRRVVLQLTADAVATATLLGNRRMTMTLSSAAIATAVAVTMARMSLTLTSTAEAEASVRLPSGSLPAVWMNTTTNAGATWDGLPFNSMVEDFNNAGNVYGAGVGGIYKFTPKADDNGARMTAAVLWDLSDFGTHARKRVGNVYVVGKSEVPFVVRVVNHQGAFEYSTILPRHDHSTNYRAKTGRGLDSSFYRIGVSADGYCECEGVIIDYLETARRI